ncbi:fructose-specific PTS transporter subunit EIIC [Aerococcus urinae]|uniref:PTS fructose transporter subunit IIABC n=1 Tax=Aerococcus urinae TaxID=1376 RepID=UPI0018E0CEE0|nr:fructose-specific PTS transporter subunit EIIC [Aerococcus urinae]
MKLSDLFVKEAMDLNLQTDSKKDTLVHLAKRFSDCGGVSDAQAYVEKLEAREAQSTTGVGDEIAIPHAQHESIKEAAIIFARSAEGIEWESFDGQPAKLIFMIAAPEGGGGEHLKALAQLSKVLLKDGVKDALLKAESPDEVLEIIKAHDESEEAAEEKSEAKAAPVEADKTDSTDNDVYIVAVTACPTVIAHTYMAEERLKKAGKAAGYRIKVETNGQSGVENRLTKKDIEEATAVIVAADKQVEMARFDGKPIIIVPVGDGVNKADQLVERAANDKLPIYHAKKGQNAEEEESSDGETLGRLAYKHLMNGVSHMLPFVVAGGILIALSFFWGITSADPAADDYNQIAQALNTVGNLSFAMMLPMLAGFIGHSMADRIGLVIGVIGGICAEPSKFAAFTGVGIFENSVSSGFLGALVAGFLAGGIVWLLEKLFAWLPKSLNGMKSIFLYPVLGVLIMGFLMLFVINGPMGAVMNGLMSLINSIPPSMTIILGFVVGAMMSIDMGGPINKAAYVTGTALVTASAGAGSNVMAAVMCGGMVPPLAIAISATLQKSLWTVDERNSAYVNYVMGAAFITEGAIPFAAKDPLHVIPPLALGSGIAGALSMFFGCVSYVPHGGVFAVLAGGVTNGLMFLLSWLIGGAIAGILLNVFLNRAKTSEEAQKAE